MTTVVVWLLTVQAMALGVLPLTFRVFRALPDRGYGFSKVLGLMVVGYPAWLLSMLGVTTYGRGTTTVLAIAIGVACWGAWGAECRAALRARWRLLLLLELTFLLVFGAAAFVRAFNADIVGQEKFMDYALMNAFLRADDLPAEDPWLAGSGVPYYYLGYLLLGLPAKITATPGPIAYNLALVFVFAAGFLGAMSVVYGILTPLHEASIAPDWSALLFALFGGAMVMLLGNLEGLLELLAARGWGDSTFWQAVGVKGLAATSGTNILPPDGGWWWRASRVIPNIQPDGITEFPYFSFLLGDLHPHYMAIPLDLLIVGLALASWRGDGSIARRPPLPVAAVALGVLLAAHTWDVPTFWGLMLLVGLVALWCRRRGQGWDRADAVLLVGPFALAAVAIAPYFVGYEAQRLGVGLVRERTPLISMLILFGPTLAVATTFGLWMLRRHGGRTAAAAPGPRRSLPSIALTAAALGALALSLVGEQTLALLTLVAGLLVTGGWGWLTADRIEPLAAGTLFNWMLALAAVAILIVVEVVYVHDVFGTRMNTVFKLHYNAWLLLATAGAGALGLLWASARRAGGSGTAWRVPVVALGAVLATSGLVYPLAATWTKSGRFRGAPTLDGAAFLQRASPTDYEAIQWLQANVRGRPVVIEAVGPDYGEHARVSTFSGLPTVVGWIGHEVQWRGDGPRYERRERDVDAIYRAETLDALTARAREYRAHYVFFGELERQRYGSEARERLGRLLPTAFARGGTVVYSLWSDDPAGEPR